MSIRGAVIKCMNFRGRLVVVRDKDLCFCCQLVLQYLLDETFRYVTDVECGNLCCS